MHLIGGEYNQWSKVYFIGTTFSLLYWWAVSGKLAFCINDASPVKQL